MDPSRRDPLSTAWDPDTPVGGMLRGRRGLVVGIANADSIACGCAATLRAFRAELAVTWLNEKAERFVRPLAEGLGASIMMPLDVEAPGQTEAVFARIGAAWGRLDFVIHSIAFAPRADLEPPGIRAYAVSPRPLQTRAASGIAQFGGLVEMAVSRAPAGRLVDVAEVGRVVAFLVSGAGSAMTGDTIHVDGSLHNMA